jgi:hypothetical protein
LEEYNMMMSRPTRDHKEIRKWADARGVIPVEELPSVVDHEPALMRLVHSEQVKKGDRHIAISWEDFFAKFDNLQLVCVYAQDETGYNEILQVQGQSPIPGQEIVQDRPRRSLDD